MSHAKSVQEINENSELEEIDNEVSRIISKNSLYTSFSPGSLAGKILRNSFHGIEEIIKHMIRILEHEEMVELILAFYEADSDMCGALIKNTVDINIELLTVFFLLPTTKELYKIVYKLCKDKIDQLINDLSSIDIGKIKTLNTVDSIYKKKNISKKTNLCNKDIDADYKNIPMEIKLLAFNKLLHSGVPIEKVNDFFKKNASEIFDVISKIKMKTGITLNILSNVIFSLNKTDSISLIEKIHKLPYIRLDESKFFRVRLEFLNVDGIKEFLLKLENDFYLSAPFINYKYLTKKFPQFTNEIITCFIRALNKNKFIPSSFLFKLCIMFANMKDIKLTRETKETMYSSKVFYNILSLLQDKNRIYIEQVIDLDDVKLLGAISDIINVKTPKPNYHIIFSEITTNKFKALPCTIHYLYKVMDFDKKGYSGDKSKKKYPVAGKVKIMEWIYKKVLDEYGIELPFLLILYIFGLDTKLDKRILSTYFGQERFEELSKHTNNIIRTTYVNMKLLLEKGQIEKKLRKRLLKLYVIDVDELIKNIEVFDKSTMVILSINNHQGLYNDKIKVQELIDKCK